MDLTALREHIGEGPADDVLERLLDAAVEAINERAGYVSDEISELLRPSGSLVRLSRRALGITSVIEGIEPLDYTEYLLRPGGRLLVRLDDSGDPMVWTGWADVTYEPYPDDAERDRVTLKLVELDLNNQPGLQGSTIASWAEQYAASSVFNYEIEREALLSSLRRPTTGVW